jgi:hypothetical protein
MARTVHPTVLDAALAIVATADLMVVTASMPEDYEEALANRLAEVPLSVDDFAIENGVGSLRQLHVTATGLASASASGLAAHVALLDSANNRLVYVTKCAPLSLIAGQIVQVMAWHVAIGAPL